jgi:mono/diheme cytochrome c family protein
MRFPIALSLIVVLGSQGLVASQEDPHLGELGYEISCLGCHGPEGRGDGPRTKALKTAPADLTQITRQNNGTFPLEAVIALIDGRSLDAAHEERDMPVWGKRYRVSADTTESADWIDRRIHAQIAALARYIESLQED